MYVGLCVRVSACLCAWASVVASWFYLLLFLLLLALRSVGWVCMLLVRFGLSLVALEMGAT
jgi:cytochrome b561